MIEAEHHVHRLATEVRNGVTRTILVVETEIPLPPETHIDKDNLPQIVDAIKQSYVKDGKTIDEVRVVSRGT
jgi:hypothetical protein